MKDEGSCYRITEDGVIVDLGKWLEWDPVSCRWVLGRGHLGSYMTGQPVSRADAAAFVAISRAARSALGGWPTVRPLLAF